MSILQTFLGRQLGGVRLANRNIRRNVNNLNALQFQTTGTLTATEPGTSGLTLNIAGEWWTQSPVAAPPFPGENYEVRLTVVSGLPQDPALSSFSPDPDTWYRLNVQRDFARFGWSGSVIRLEIRPFGGTTIVASAEFTMTT